MQLPKKDMQEELYPSSLEGQVLPRLVPRVTRTEPRGNKVMRTRESPKRKVTLLNSLHDEGKGEPIQLITQEEVRNPKARIVRGLDSGA